MVFHKRLDYGSSGYRVPRFLQVPNSARRKRSPRRKLEDKQMCAFDLLATVAGELLLERDSTLLQCEVPAVAKGFPKKENVEYEKPIKVEVFDQGSCNESSKLCSPKIVGKDATEPMVAFRMGESTPKKSYPGQMASCKSEVGMKTPLQEERRISCNGNGLQISNDPMDLDSKPPALVSSDSSAEFPISRTTSFPNYGKEISVDRDDDENNSMCTNRRISTSKGFRPQRIGDNRIKKMLASKYWKVAPKDGELSNAEMKGSYRNRKLCYTRQRTQKCSSRRRKFLDRRSMSASYLDMFDESVSPKLAGIKMEPSNASLASLNTAKGASSSTSGQADYHVKLCIKSFKVPELFIEIPENATVGSLKRTVMEAVTAILGGGLRIGVLHEGKKVRDDNKTLLQAGISHNDRMDNLGFTLEPSSSPILPSLLCAEDPNSVTTSNITEQLKMIPAQPPTLELAVASEVTPQAPQRSDYDSVYSPADTCSIDKMADSKALVPVPSMNVRPLNAVPLPKSRRMELVQRRIRRPFSVSEVEALVQAVEKLGTGRWRDVKIRSFDNAKHRTYVDLKDKWKTLVHTAEISPQQRRGEPVPQELLDRVLSAHAYWSTHQAKSPAAEACLLA